MRCPLIALAAGATLLVTLFGIGLGGMVRRHGGIIPLSLGPHGRTSSLHTLDRRLGLPVGRSPRSKALVRFLVLIALGVWWIAGIGLIVALVGVALLVYSLAQLAGGRKP